MDSLVLEHICDLLNDYQDQNIKITVDRYVLRLDWPNGKSFAWDFSGQFTNRGLLMFNQSLQRYIGKENLCE